MTTYLTNRDGGKTNEEGHIRFQTKLWSGSVVTGLQAVQKNPLSMGIDISVGDAKVDYSTYSYTVWTDALVSVVIATADPSNPRIDRIVGYVDRSQTPSSVSSNNPGLLKFMAIAGTPAAAPVRPSDATVQAAVGASNPYFNIADILVGTGVTTIYNANITDKRVMVTTAAVTDASITNAKLATGAGEPGGAWQGWTPTLTNHTGTINSARYTQIGKTVHFDLRVTITAVTGGLAFTLPVTGKAGVIENDRIFLSSLHMFDAGTAHHWGILTGASTTNAAELWYRNGTSTATITSATGPFTWAAGDVYVATGTYEAA